MTKNTILKMFVSLICASQIFLLCPNKLEASTDSYTETWHNYLYGVYDSNITTTYSTVDRYGNGIPVYKYYYKAKNIVKKKGTPANFNIKQTAGGVSLNTWNTNGKTWHITEYYSDIDVANNSWDYSTYWQPKVVLRCNGRDIKTLQENHWNVETNGGGSGLDLTCNGTVEWYSYGDTGNGRNRTVVGGDNHFWYWYEEISPWKESGWVWNRSDINAYEVQSSPSQSAYVRPTYKLNNGDWKRTPYSVSSTRNKPIIPVQVPVTYYSNGATSGDTYAYNSSLSAPNTTWKKDGYTLNATIYDSSGNPAWNWDAGNMNGHNIKNILDSRFNNFNSMALQGSSGNYYLKGSTVNLYANWFVSKYNFVFNVQSPYDNDTKGYPSNELYAKFNGNTYYGNQKFSFNKVASYNDLASNYNFTTIDTYNDKYEFLGWFAKDGTKVLDANNKLVNNSSLVKNGYIKPDTGILDSQIPNKSLSQPSPINIQLYGKWKMRDTTPPVVEMDQETFCPTEEWYNGWYNKESINYTKFLFSVRDYGNPGSKPSGIKSIELFNAKGTLIKKYEGNQLNSSNCVESEIHIDRCKTYVYIDRNLFVNMNSSSDKPTNKFYIIATDNNNNATRYDGEAGCIDLDAPRLKSHTFNSQNSYYSLTCPNGDFNFTSEETNGKFTIKFEFDDSPIDGVNSSGMKRVGGSELTDSHIKVYYYDRASKKWMPHSNYPMLQSVENSIEFTIDSGDKSNAYLNFSFKLCDIAGNCSIIGKDVGDTKLEDWKNDSSSDFCKVTTNSKLETDYALTDFSYVFDLAIDLEERNLDIKYLYNDCKKSKNDAAQKAYAFMESYIRFTYHHDSFKDDIIHPDMYYREAVQKFLETFNYELYKATRIE